MDKDLLLTQQSQYHPKNHSEIPPLNNPISPSSCMIPISFSPNLLVPPVYSVILSPSFCFSLSFSVTCPPLLTYTDTHTHIPCCPLGSFVTWPNSSFLSLLLLLYSFIMGLSLLFNLLSVFSCFFFFNLDSITPKQLTIWKDVAVLFFFSWLDCLFTSLTSVFYLIFFLFLVAFFYFSI